MEQIKQQHINSIYLSSFFYVILLGAKATAANDRSKDAARSYGYIVPDDAYLMEYHLKSWCYEEDKSEKVNGIFKVKYLVSVFPTYDDLGIHRMRHHELAPFLRMMYSVISPDMYCAMMYWGS